MRVPPARPNGPSVWIRGLGSDDPNVRYACEDALYRFGLKHPARLIGMLPVASPDPEVQCRSDRIVTRLRDDQLLPCLLASGNLRRSGRERRNLRALYLASGWVFSGRLAAVKEEVSPTAHHSPPQVRYKFEFEQCVYFGRPGLVMTAMWIPEDSPFLKRLSVVAERMRVKGPDMVRLLVFLNPACDRLLGLYGETKEAVSLLEQWGETMLEGNIKQDSEK